MKVPFFNYPDVFLHFEDDFVDALKRVGRNGSFIMQDELKNFERRLAEYAGVKYAIGVANATDALELIMMADNLQPGDEVIMSAHTMIATASAVKMLGGVPVPVDMDSDRTIMVEDIEENITSRTKYIMPTHLNGRIADMSPICEIAERRGLKIIEDSAQSLGARYKGQHGGSFGLGGCISFYPAKVLGCLGDGGAVLTDDEDIYKKVLALRDHGRSDFGVYVSWGRNSRLDNLQAEFLNVQFSRYPRVVERRREVANIYSQLLDGVDEVSLPPLPDADPDRFDIFQNFEIEAERRDELVTYLKENQIGTLTQWGGLGLNHISELDLSKKLKNTDRFFKVCTMLPMNYSVTDAEVSYVGNKIREFYGYGAAV